MQLSHELPDYAYTLRAADGRSAKVNDRVLTASFVLSPSELREDVGPARRRLADPRGPGPPAGVAAGGHPAGDR